TPLTRLTLGAASVADDLGYVALSDLARRCLEIAFAAGLGPEDFTRGVRAQAAEVIRSLFGSRRGVPVAALAAEQHLSAEAADARFTRIRALITRVLGPA